MTINLCASVNFVRIALWLRISALHFQTIKSIVRHIRPQIRITAALRLVQLLIRTYTQKCGTVSPTLYRVGQLKRTAITKLNSGVGLISVNKKCIFSLNKQII
jgi:hypothetical protein